LDWNKQTKKKQRQEKMKKEKKVKKYTSTKEMYDVH